MCMTIFDRKKMQISCFGKDLMDIECEIETSEVDGQRLAEF